MATYSGYDLERIANPRFREVLQLILDITNGHNHDGTNSKSVTAGTPASGALTADANGRAIIASDFFDAATVLAKFATDSFDNAQLLKAIKDGAFAADASTRALFATGIWNLAKLDTNARTRIITYQIEDLAAGVDIADRSIFFAPTGIDATLVSADIIPQGSNAGIDDSNTCVIKLADNSGNTIVQKTYNTSTTMPSAGVVGNLGSLDGTYKVLSSGEKLLLSVANGNTANPPGLLLQLTFSVADAA